MAQQRVQRVPQDPKTETKVWIPEVPPERIQVLAYRIKPVVRFSAVRIESNQSIRLIRSLTGELYYIEPVDLHEAAYTWFPKPTVIAQGLKPIETITTYHTYHNHGIFKPSIAEVLAQIPEHLIDEVAAFETVTFPQFANDLNREREALKAGYHVATTQLYGRK